MNAYRSRGNWDDGQITENIASYSEIDEKSLDSDIWRKLVNNLVYDLKQGKTGPVEARWTEAEIISPIVGFELEQAFGRALEALPDSKAWAKLEQQEKSTA